MCVSMVELYHSGYTCVFIVSGHIYVYFENFFVKGFVFDVKLSVMSPFSATFSCRYGRFREVWTEVEIEFWVRSMRLDGLCLGESN